MSFTPCCFLSRSQFELSEVVVLTGLLPVLLCNMMLMILNSDMIQVLISLKYSKLDVSADSCFLLCG